MNCAARDRWRGEAPLVSHTHVAALLAGPFRSSLSARCAALRESSKAAAGGRQTVTPPAGGAAPAAAAFDDSLGAAQRALNDDRNGPARSAATWVWETRGASPRQRSRAAQFIAETYSNENDIDGYRRWLQHAVDADANNSAAAEALRRLGPSQ